MKFRLAIFVIVFLLGNLTILISESKHKSFNLDITTFEAFTGYAPEYKDDHFELLAFCRFGAAFSGRYLFEDSLSIGLRSGLYLTYLDGFMFSFPLDLIFRWEIQNSDFTIEPYIGAGYDYGAMYEEIYDIGLSLNAGSKFYFHDFFINLGYTRYTADIADALKNTIRIGIGIQKSNLIN